MRNIVLLLITGIVLLSVGESIESFIGTAISTIGAVLLPLIAAVAVMELRKKKLANKYADSLAERSIVMASDIGSRLKKDDCDSYAMHITGLGLILLKRDLVQGDLKTSTQQDILNEVKPKVLSKVFKTKYLIAPHHIEDVFDKMLSSLFSDFNGFIHSSLRSGKVDDLVIYDLTRSLAKAIKPDDEVSVRPIAGRIVHEIVEFYQHNKPVIKQERKSSKYLSLLSIGGANNASAWKKIIPFIVAIAVATGGYQFYQYNRAPNEQDRLSFLYECNEYIARGMDRSTAKAVCGCLWPNLVGRYQSIGKINEKARYDGEVSIGGGEVNAMAITCLDDHHDNN